MTVFEVNIQKSPKVEKIIVDIIKKKKNRKTQESYNVVVFLGNILPRLLKLQSGPATATYHSNDQISHKP